MNDLKNLRDIYLFLLSLMIKIKLMSEMEFKSLFKDLDYQQTVYAIYFRYI